MKKTKYKNLLIIINIYLFISIPLILQKESEYNNIINPIFWLCILGYLIWNIKTSYIKFNKNKKDIINMFIISAIHIIIYYYFGFIIGFTKSPYNHKLFGIIKNITTQAIPIVGIELTRNIIATKNKENKKILIILTIILLLLEINYKTIISLYTNKEEFFKYTFSTIIPTISSNILYTYLTTISSYKIVLIYRFFKELINFILPVLPNMNWYIKGISNILSIIIVYILFKFKIINSRKKQKKEHKNVFEKTSYTITLIFIVILTFFKIGIFKYESISILSNSMQPTFCRGDVVIFKKISEEELKEIQENEIIIYTIENQNIIHRVVNKIEDNNNVIYQTKGDSNNVVDTNLVQLNQIKGIYIFHIKYIGFPSIWLYDYFNKESANVEIK